MEVCNSGPLQMKSEQLKLQLLSARASGVLRDIWKAIAKYLEFCALSFIPTISNANLILIQLIEQLAILDITNMRQKRT